MARLILVIHIIRYKSGETTSLNIDCKSLEMGHKLGKYFLANAYKTINQRYDKDNPFADIPHQKEYSKIVRWVKSHKSPMDIRTMIINRCFKNKAEAYENSNTSVQKLAKDYSSYKEWGGKGLIIMAKNYHALGDAYQATYILESVTTNFSQYPEIVAEARGELSIIKAKEAKSNSSVKPDGN